MVMALIGISGSAHGAPPPNRPTITSLPPLLRQSKPSCVVAALPTRSITARIGPPAFWASCSSASGALPSTVASAPALSPPLAPAPPAISDVGPLAIEGGERAGLLGRFALARIDIDDDGALAAHRLQQRQRHQAETAGAENDDRGIEAGLDLLQGAVGGDARAGIRRRGHGIETVQIQEILRMRHRHVIGIAA